MCHKGLLIGWGLTFGGVRLHHFGGFCVGFCNSCRRDAPT
jgi:hypothetical protein